MTATAADRSRGAGGAGLPEPRRKLSRAEALGGSLPALLVAAERVAATVSQGVHGRRRAGEGEAFWQFRRYRAGDPAQRIDWRQSAKADRLYVRETEWEAAQSVWLWRDGSASMRWRSSSGQPSKLDRAELLLLAIASLLSRGGEHFALLGSGTTLATGRSALLRMVAELERECSAPGNGEPHPTTLPRHARLVLFGDFLSPLENLSRTIDAHSRRGVRGHLVQIIDPAEESLPFSGRVLFEGSENEGHVLFGRVQSIRDAYQAAFIRHQAGIRELARLAGWTMLTHRTDHPPQAAVLALYLALGAPI